MTTATEFSAAAGNAEPSLCEVLDDPMVKMVMRRDGVTRADLERLIRRARDRLLARDIGLAA